jgi:hypothetical protein
MYPVPNGVGALDAWRFQGYDARIHRSHITALKITGVKSD